MAKAHEYMELSNPTYIVRAIQPERLFLMRDDMGNIITGRPGDYLLEDQFGRRVTMSAKDFESTFVGIVPQRVRL